MHQITVYFTKLAIAVTATILGALSILALLAGAYSGNVASMIVAYLVAFSLLINCEGTVKLFLNKSHDFVNSLADAALPAFNLKDSI